MSNLKFVTMSEVEDGVDEQGQPNITNSIRLTTKDDVVIRVMITKDGYEIDVDGTIVHECFASS